MDLSYELDFHNTIHAKEITYKYYTSFKKLANMQHKIQVQAPGLSVYHLCIVRCVRKHNRYDQWLMPWTATTKPKWPVHTKRKCNKTHTPHLIRKYKACCKYTQYSEGFHCCTILLDNSRLYLHTLYESVGSKQSFEYIRLPRCVTAKRACLTFTHTS
jgi:hypothetical protein